MVNHWRYCRLKGVCVFSKPDFHASQQDQVGYYPGCPPTPASPPASLTAAASPDPTTCLPRLLCRICCQQPPSLFLNHVPRLPWQDGGQQHPSLSLVLITQAPPPNTPTPGASPPASLTAAALTRSNSLRAKASSAGPGAAPTRHSTPHSMILVVLVLVSVCSASITRTKVDDKCAVC
jgi:hypothetical protein